MSGEEYYSYQVIEQRKLFSEIQSAVRGLVTPGGIRFQQLDPEASGYQKMAFIMFPVNGKCTNGEIMVGARYLIDTFDADVLVQPIDTTGRFMGVPVIWKQQL